MTNETTNKRPSVAIVGRPNVGKSTFFNRLLGYRSAIVEDVPGITRDRISAEAEWCGVVFNLIDTGGILMSASDPLMDQIRIQANMAMSEADVILFMVDAVDGMTAADQELADALRGSKTPVIIAVNKTDNLKREVESAEFYSLGFNDLFTISCVHGHGVADILDRVVELLPKSDGEVAEDENIKLSIVGRPNVGKSSLVNALLGEQRLIVSDIAGTTRDAIDTRLKWNDQEITLIDTAGIRRAGKVQGSVEYYSVLRAQRAISRCDVAVLVVDGSAGVTEGDKRVGGIIVEEGRACIVVVNKWDLTDNPKSRTLMKDYTAIFRKEVPFLSFAPLVFASALERSGIKHVITTALDAAEMHAHRIPTGLLNRVVKEASEVKPYSRKGKSLRIYYATMASVKPPTIVLFVNDAEICHFSYLRYLENAIRRHVAFEGTPIRIVVKEASYKKQDE